MKKIVVLGIAAGLICLPCLIVNAAPVGNVASPVIEQGEYGFKIGLEGDFVSERELDVSGAELEWEMNFYMAKLSYTIEERADIYLLLGEMTDAKVTNKYDSTIAIYDVDDEFAWGIGATILTYESDNGLFVGVDGKYRSSGPDISKVNIDGTDYAVTDVECELNEWQLALAVSKQFDKFVPYAGVKYSDVEAQAKATVSGTTYETEKINSKDVFGVFVGTSFLPTENFSVNLEDRFIDETAFSLGVSYKF